MKAKRLPGYVDRGHSKKGPDRRPDSGQCVERPSRLAALNTASETSTPGYSSGVAIGGAIALAFGVLADYFFFGGTCMRLVQDIVGQARAAIDFHI